MTTNEIVTLLNAKAAQQTDPSAAFSMLTTFSEWNAVIEPPRVLRRLLGLSQAITMAA